MQRKEGVIGLFKGNSINCLGAAPFTALEFYLYEFFKNNLWPEVQYQDLTLRHKFICGGFAGMCAQSLLNPLDVIKTHYTIEQNPSKSARSLVIEKAKLKGLCETIESNPIGKYCSVIANEISLSNP